MKIQKKITRVLFLYFPDRAQEQKLEEHTPKIQEAIKRNRYWGDDREYKIKIAIQLPNQKHVSQEVQQELKNIMQAKYDVVELFGGNYDPRTAKRIQAVVPDGVRVCEIT